MILTPFEFARPSTLKQATALLAGTGGSRPLAGGQSLLVDLTTGEAEARLLVDLALLDELRGIQRRRDGGLSIGAMTTLAELATHPEVRTAAPALAEAAGANGDPQVRNRGTVGGNLAADRSGPGLRATDLPVAAIALDAVLTLTDTKRSWTLPAAELAEGLPVGAVITSLDLPGPGSGGSSRSAFEKSADRASLYPVCAVAVRLNTAEDGSEERYRIAVTGATEKPVRIPEVEARLAGTRPGTGAVLEAFAAVPPGVFVPGRGGSAEYLRHLAGVLTSRALARAGA